MLLAEEKEKRKNSQKSYAQEVELTTVTFPSIPSPGELKLFHRSFKYFTQDTPSKEDIF